MKEAPKVYLARAGRNGEDEDCALENNLAVIGFLEVPSLAGARSSPSGLRSGSRSSAVSRPRPGFSGDQEC